MMRWCMSFRKFSPAAGWIPCPIRANIAGESSKVADKWLGDRHGQQAHFPDSRRLAAGNVGRIRGRLTKYAGCRLHPVLRKVEGGRDRGPQGKLAAARGSFLAKAGRQRVWERSVERHRFS